MSKIDGPWVGLLGPILQDAWRKVYEPMMTEKEFEDVMMASSLVCNTLRRAINDRDTVNRKLERALRRAIKTHDFLESQHERFTRSPLPTDYQQLVGNAAKTNDGTLDKLVQKGSGDEPTLGGTYEEHQQD